MICNKKNKYTLKYFYYRILSNFVINKARKAKLKERKNFYNTLRNSKSEIIVTGKENKFDILDVAKSNVKLKIYGNNNEIKIGKNSNLKGLTIIIRGNNNAISIGDNCSDYGNSSFINLGKYCSNSSLCIGDYFGFTNFQVHMEDPNSELEIGNNVMIAHGTMIFVSDTHSVCDLHTRKLLNMAKKCKIGNHVWIGRDVKIGKSALIPDNTIVGWGSIVMSKFSENYTVIAGNPATIVKQGVDWDWRCPAEYLKSQKADKQMLWGGLNGT